jgi:hypothetical protein
MFRKQLTDLNLPRSIAKIILMAVYPFIKMSGLFYGSGYST